MQDTKKFNFTTNELDNIEIIYLEGFLDAHTAPILEKAISNLIENKKINLLFNFSKLEYISSAGLGVFMSFIEEIREQKGDIKMSSMSEKVFSVFDLLGFNILFDINSDEELLINKFKELSL